ncbi:MAG: hypothetical protein FWG87_04195 [Defluviitaleaceae bacterium]|nr:hypothetical protein [Defluviitaleaceae bacterium]
MHDNDYILALNNLKGKTIAVVYIFEKEDAAGFDHYHVWKSDIISGWLNAVQELECLPFILDVRTFVSKAINGTLPNIDFVINLNCGSCELSSMSLIPSICSFISIPCIPCNAASIVMGENKMISNLLAEAMNLNTPKNLDPSCNDGVFRPLNLGSSIGLRRGFSNENKVCGIYQEFIQGYDVTIPIVHNPIINDLDILPPILFIPKSHDPNWMYDEKEKIKDNGFITLPMLKISEELKCELINYAKIFPIQTFARIDARLKSTKKKLSESTAETILMLDDFYFIEINPMPTVEKDDSFEYALKAAFADENHSFYQCVDSYKKSIRDSSINGFILSCSMLALSTTKC